ncbi:hypothetical protein [Sphingobacterium sp. CZ-UAM]|uniref:hypothetical protein n=1 Tax=Sphingobacterium sp. CZ-UAM TaxID=1933868 RepID=UPI0011155762|nr:hypothetical protein [Sphingobacterium sp. CZ-UAM]
MKKTDCRSLLLSIIILLLLFTSHNVSAQKQGEINYTNEKAFTARVDSAAAALVAAKEHISVGSLMKQAQIIKNNVLCSYSIGKSV